MENYDLIILPMHDYKKWINEGFRTRDGHLFEHFKKDKNISKILVVNRPVSLAECLIKKKSWKTSLGQVVYEEKNWQLVKADNNVYYIDYYIADFLKVLIEQKKWWYTCFNNKGVINAINKSTEIIKMNNRCLLLQNPMSIGVVNKLKETLFIFDSIDNWLHHPQMNKHKTLIENNYKFIMKNADLIFTVSESLKNFFSNREDVHWISNGVDLDYFTGSIKKVSSRDDVKIGYVGKIQERVDFELIEQCLKRFPNYSFIFLGPILSCKKEVKRLQDNYLNVHFYGDIHYNDLPSYMKEFDVTIIPHKVNSFTNSMNPLKLYEYLASGKQVVTTEVAGTEMLSEYVYESKTNQEFLNNIEYAINQLFNKDDLSDKIINSVNIENTWSYKVDKMNKLISDKLKCTK